jgi:hypothetical protein
MNQHARQYYRQSSRPAGPGRLYPGQPAPIVQFGTGSMITTVPGSPSRTAATCAAAPTRNGHTPSPRTLHRLESGRLTPMTIAVGRLPLCLRRERTTRG